jgi:hypothetical protein
MYWHGTTYNAACPVEKFQNSEKKHLDLVRASGGKCVCAERNLKKLAEKYGDGDIDWGERINVDFVYSKRVLWVYENISFIVGYC